MRKRLRGFRERSRFRLVQEEPIERRVVIPGKRRLQRDADGVEAGGEAGGAAGFSAACRCVRDHKRTRKRLHEFRECKRVALMQEGRVDRQLRTRREQKTHAHTEKTEIARSAECMKDKCRAHGHMGIRRG